jgi:serine/threonine-protein kinase
MAHPEDELDIDASPAEAPSGFVEVQPEAELSWFTGVLDDGDGAEIKGDGIDAPTPIPLPRHSPARVVDLGELAAGGMATIRRAFDRNIRRQVAIKRVGSADKEVSDALHFLVEEAQITGQLEHPNIVPVYDLGAAADGTAMFVMRLVHGRTLTKVMREYWRGGRNPILLREILEVLLKVCDAIAYAHSRGVVHRDLKPDNIMIGSHGQVYVMDWGCALLLAGSDAELPGGVRSRRAEPNVVLGTAAYMAPEQARGEVVRVVGRADVYTLGAILYQLLTEQPPHRGANFVERVRTAQVGAVLPPATARPDLDLPPGLVAIAMRALSVRRDDRFATIEELRAELDRFVAGIDWFPRRRFEPGEVIVRQGEDAYTAYVIESGTCEVSREVRGTHTAIRQIGRGDVFGETAIFTDQLRSATVVAIDHVVAIELTRSAFEARIGIDSWLGIFMRTLARRFRDAERRLDAVGASTIYARILEATIVHLHAAGVPAGPGRLMAPWSPLRRSLSRRVGVDELLVTEALRGSSELIVDEARDLVTGPTPDDDAP